jgi:hypothetical protein
MDSDPSGPIVERADRLHFGAEEALSSKSNTSKLLAIRLGFTDLGITILPSWIRHLINTWAGASCRARPVAPTPLVDGRHDAGGIDWDAVVTLAEIRQCGDHVELVARHVGLPATSAQRGTDRLLGVRGGPGRL